MCNKFICIEPFLLKYCLNRYKTQELCEKAINDFLPTLKFVPHWFATSKKIKNLMMNYHRVMI